MKEPSPSLFTLVIALEEHSSENSSSSASSHSVVENAEARTEQQHELNRSR